MAQSAFAAWLGVVVLALTAGYCVLRTHAAHRRGDKAGRRVDAAQALMAVAMAAMLCPLAAAMPRAGWLVVFGALSGVLLALAGRGLRRDGARGCHPGEGTCLGQQRPERGGRGGARPVRRHCWHHLVGSLAMVYLLLAAPAPMAAGHPMASMAAAMPEMAAAGPLPGLVGPLLGYFVGYALWSGARLVRVASASGAGHGAGGAPAWALTAPELAIACEIVMGLGMAYMALAMA